MTPIAPECLVYGAIISLAVSLLKRIPFVKNHPKVIAFILSIAVSLFPTVMHGLQSGAADIGALVTCVLAQLGTAIGVHEVVTQEFRKRVLPAEKL
jgi:hypothetical protein